MAINGGYNPAKANAPADADSPFGYDSYGKPMAETRSQQIMREQQENQKVQEAQTQKRNKRAGRTPPPVGGGVNALMKWQKDQGIQDQQWNNFMGAGGTEEQWNAGFAPAAPPPVPGGGTQTAQEGGPLTNVTRNGGGIVTPPWAPPPQPGGGADAAQGGPALNALTNQVSPGAGPLKPGVDAEGYEFGSLRPGQTQAGGANFQAVGTSAPPPPQPGGGADAQQQGGPRGASAYDLGIKGARKQGGYNTPEAARADMARIDQANKVADYNANAQNYSRMGGTPAPFQGVRPHGDVSAPTPPLGFPNTAAGGGPSIAPASGPVGMGGASSPAIGALMGGGGAAPQQTVATPTQSMGNQQGSNPNLGRRLPSSAPMQGLTGRRLY